MGGSKAENTTVGTRLKVEDLRPFGHLVSVATVGLSDASVDRERERERERERDLSR